MMALLLKPSKTIRFQYNILIYILILTGCNMEQPQVTENPKDEYAVTLERIAINASFSRIKGTSSLKLNKNNKQAFAATGYYSDGSTKVITDELKTSAWRSSDPEIAFFSESGLLVAGAEAGEVSINAFNGDIVSNSMLVEVTDAVIDSIAVTPASASIAQGQTQRLTATATYSDNTSADISDSVTWRSDDLTTATVTSDGLLTGVARGTTTLSAFKDNVTSNSVSIDVTNAVIDSIAVTPASGSLAKGQTKQLTATATYSDNTSSDISDSVKWRSDDLTIATVMSDGLLTGVARGTTTLSAFKDNVTSNSVSIDVTNAVINSIAVTPASGSLAKGQTKQLTATATYSDNTSSDISDSVTWRSDDLTTATVTSDGLLTGLARGTATLSAFKDNVTSNDVSVDVTDAVIDSIAVTPASMLLAKGVTQQLTATAIYSDNTSSDISHLVTWRSDDVTVSSVTPNGLLTAEGKGRVTLSAFKDNVTSNNVSVDVTDAVINSIVVTPASMLLAKGVTQQLTATATYSDSTSSDISGLVTWRSDDVTVASVTPNGLLKAEGKGTVMLSAMKDNMTSNRVSVEVTNAVIDSLAITPASVLLAKGQTKQLTATATYSDNTSSDVSDLVTWYSDDVTIASVTPNGLLNAEGKGTVRLSAMKDNVTSNSVSVDVTDAAIDSIAVTPVSVSIAKGLSQQLTATATYSDNTSSDITHLVTWRSDDLTVASVTPSGFLKAEDKGTATLSAFKDNVASNSVSVDVTAALLNSITVTPASVSITEGHTQQLTAMATYSDNTSSDISNMVTWSVSNSLVTVTSNGLLTGVRSGPVTVSAFKDNVTSNGVTVQVKSCSSVGGTCVNGFNFNNKIFTNSPSKSFLDSIGIGGNYDGQQEYSTDFGFGADKFLYVSLKKAEELCKVHYNDKKIKGRTNWRLPTRNELLDLSQNRNMYNTAGWPTHVEYWTSNPAGPPGYYHHVNLDSGSSGSTHKDDKNYVSCVSD